MSERGYEKEMKGEENHESEEAGKEAEKEGGRKENTLAFTGQLKKNKNKNKNKKV
jgi:hypothetical protein